MGLPRPTPRATQVGASRLPACKDSQVCEEGLQEAFMRPQRTPVAHSLLHPDLTSQSLKVTPSGLGLAEAPPNEGVAAFPVFSRPGDTGEQHGRIQKGWLWSGSHFCFPKDTVHVGACSL